MARKKQSTHDWQPDSEPGCDQDPLALENLRDDDAITHGLHARDIIGGEFDRDGGDEPLDRILRY